MNIRGICCLRPGVPGKTDRIKVFSIVGRFLEHPRIFVFGTGDDAKVYIGSADFMTRNTEHRVEIACPILDRSIRDQIRHYVEVLCSDNVKARIMGSDGHYFHVPDHGEPPVDAQAVFMAEAIAKEPPEGTSAPTPAARKGILSALAQRLRRR